MAENGPIDLVGPAAGCFHGFVVLIARNVTGSFFFLTPWARLSGRCAGSLSTERVPIIYIVSQA